MKTAIYGQFYQDLTAAIIKRLFVFLELNNIEFIIEENFYIILKENNAISTIHETFTSYKDLNSSFDLLISVGGDGTFLRAATIVRDSGIPILGINAGRLGFLATVQQENIEVFLQLVLEKKYSISKRTLLSLECSEEIEALKTLNFAMNEITVNRKDTTSMISIETYLDGEYLNSYWADGLIVSTPTGSTGYSMSCGGPIITPGANCLVITPIAPHNLNARPLIISDTTEIKLKITGREESYLVSLDSRMIPISNSTLLTIKKTDFKINLIEINKETFLKTLRNKLHWGQDKRN